MVSTPKEGSEGTDSRLQEEIQQTRPFRSKGQEAFLSMLRTADLARHRFSGLFAAHGVTFQQYNVLRILRGAGEDGLATLEIATRMIERTPGVTRILDRLEAKGWVERERGSEDRRKVWCRISREGLVLLAGLDAPVDASDNELFADIDPADVDHLVRIMDRLRERLSQP